MRLSTQVISRAKVTGNSHAQGSLENWGFFETTIISSCMHDVRLDSQLSRGTGHERGVRSVAASLLVWGAAPGMACGWGVTSPSRVAQACVNSAPKNMIRAE
jgi:hypothetical protein